MCMPAAIESLHCLDVGSISEQQCQYAGGQCVLGSFIGGYAVFICNLEHTAAVWAALHRSVDNSEHHHGSEGVRVVMSHGDHHEYISS